MNLCADAFIPLRVTFLYVLPPELYTLEELGALWNLTAEFVDIFLSDKLCEKSWSAFNSV